MSRCGSIAFVVCKILAFVNEFRFLKTENIKANHLVYLVPTWYWSRIFAECQPKLFSWKHDTCRRILLATFLVEQDR